MADHDKYESLLRKGNNLCSRSRDMGMNSAIAHKVNGIYEKCRLMENRWKDTPLIFASRLGLSYIVRGFIQCAKDTGNTAQFQKFLGYRDSSGQTALHVAASRGLRRIVMDLLQDVSEHHLISYRDDKGKTPISLLRDPMYDELIFDIMKAAVDPFKSINYRHQGNEEYLSISVNVDDQRASTSISSVDKRQGYKECSLSLYSYPKSHIDKTRGSLNKLNNGELELTFKKNTILHLVSKFGHVNYVKEILKEHPSLIYHRNFEGETPVYIAAREGNIDILEILINYVKSEDMEELATRTSDKHTALHIAIENHHAGVVFWLVKEIPQLANHINDFNESPLYLAAERGFDDIFRLIMDECKEKALNGPNGKTALHVAVNSRACTKYLLRENIDHLNIPDKHGWTPLHYAAHQNYPYTAKMLLEADPNVGYQMTTGSEDVNNSPIHIAASRGFRHLMVKLLSICPGFSELIDTKGRNILHVAVENKKIDVINAILEDDSLTNLINQRDSNGNTPIHLLMASDLEINEMEIDDRVNIYALNNENRTPLDMASSEEKRDRLTKLVDKMFRTLESIKQEYASRRKKEEKEKEKEKQGFTKIGDNVVLVVTLIATASFAGAFTVPGGFDGNEGSNQGMPILLRKAAYQIFVVANALAFSCSGCVLFMHIRLQLDKAREEKDGSPNIISLQYLLTVIAMIAMAFAFVTGSYVILAPSLGFAISLCVTSLLMMLSLSVFPRNRLGFATAILRKLV